MINKFAIVIILLFGMSFNQETKIDSSLIKNPNIALRLSLIPGIGQIYNKKYFKTILIWSTTYYIVNQYIKYSKDGYNSQYCSQYTIYNQNECRIRNRNIYAWSIVGIYMLQLIDAYVDAHLSSFPMKVKEK